MLQQKYEQGQMSKRTHTEEKLWTWGSVLKLNEDCKIQKIHPKNYTFATGGSKVG